MLKVKCVVCGKITAGRLPRASRHDVGDGTFLFPRRHKVSGVDCPDNIEEGEVVEPSNNACTRQGGTLRQNGSIWPDPYTVKQNESKPAPCG